MKQSLSMGAEWLTRKIIQQAAMLLKSTFGDLNFLKCVSIAMLGKRQSRKTLYAKAKSYRRVALYMAIRKWFGLYTMRTDKTFDGHV